MPGKITDEILEARLKCRYKAHLKMADEQGEPHDYELMLKESREQVHASARAKLLARHAGQEVPSGVPLNVALLKRGLPLLLDATFEDEDICIRFDALLRVDGASPLGSFHYIPVLFHEADRPTPDLRVLVAARAELLGPLQGKVPSAGILIHGRDYRERKVKLANVAKEARRVLRELGEDRGGQPPRLLLNNHCQVCEFRKRCHAEAVAKDDLSLLRGMSASEIDHCAKRGLFSVTQLACIFRPPRRCKKPKPRKAKHSHALQALAVRDKKIYILGNPELPASSTRIYVDIEGDPERGFTYLIGALLVAEGREEKLSFWIDAPAEEPDLLTRLLELAGRYPDAWLYSYGAYEAAFLRRMGGVTGRQEEVEKVLGRMLNVLSVIHPHVYFPVHSNGLKDVAHYLGFSWSESEASGLQSIVWRRRWEQSQARDLKDKLVTYNLEDCQALRRVTEFLEAVCPRPTSPEGERQAEHDGHPVGRVEETSRFSRGVWCVATFALPDFGFVNERAYFDYQRDRVFAHSSKAIRKSQARDRRKGKKRTSPDRTVELRAPRCRLCGSTDLQLEPDGRLARLAFDLRFRAGGIRRLGVCPSIFCRVI